MQTTGRRSKALTRVPQRQCGRLWVKNGCTVAACTSKMLVKPDQQSLTVLCIEQDIAAQRSSRQMRKDFGKSANFCVAFEYVRKFTRSVLSRQKFQMMTGLKICVLSVYVKCRLDLPLY